MISKKQKFKTVVFVLIFAMAIVGGVFGISYYKGILTFPWEVVSTQVEDTAKVEEPEVVEEKAEPVKEEVKEEPKPEVKPEEPEEIEEPEEVEPESTVANTGVKLDYYGPLHVEDGNLVDADGEIAQLTGVSSHGMSWYPEYVSADSIKSLRENLGINVIRLAVYTSDYNGYCVGGDEVQSVIKENIDNAVKAATDEDMYVIIDWHILNDNNPNEYKTEAIQFFGEMVRKYKKHDNVIYEICNEPNGDTTWDDIKKYAKEVIPVIRNVNKDALILVGTPEWSSDISAASDDPLEYDNVMYTYHFYAGTHKASARISLVSALEDGLPVFISEYGLTAANGDGEIDKKEASKWQEIIDDYQLSSCIWNLSNKDEGSALINSDCDKIADFEYEDFSDEGQYFFDLLKKHDAKDKSREDSAKEKDKEDTDEEETEKESNTRETKKK